MVFLKGTNSADAQGSRPTTTSEKEVAEGSRAGEGGDLREREDGFGREL
jgi:hypothetical protein